MKILRTAIGALCLMATSATAAPVKWTIEYTTTIWDIDGSFVYDADTDETSDIMITASYDFSTSSGVVGTRMLDTLLTRSFNGVGSDFFEFGSSSADQTNEVKVNFTTATGFNLTNAGGSVPLLIFASYRCLTADCSGTQGGGVVNPANPLVGVPVPPVPLPATIPMLLSAVGLLGWRARRRRGAALSVPS